MTRLDGKTALVTGGAKGIGAMTCRLFVEQGAKVVIADIDVSAGRRLQRSLTELGGEALFVKLDVSRAEDWAQAIQTAVTRFHKLNILVNNAGIALFKGLMETSLEEWQRTLLINDTGVFLGMQQVIAHMKENGEACSIINHSSVSGQVGDDHAFAYCASKGAVTLMTKAAALECCRSGWNIRVNSVHPGVVYTAITQQQMMPDRETEEQTLERLAALNPIGRLGQPLDIAYADLYLASDESSFVTGAELNVDGGYIAQ